MSSSPSLERNHVFGDLRREIPITRRVLAALPQQHFDTQPHTKSMSLAQLASHVADLLEWARMSLIQDVLDISQLPPSSTAATLSELLARFDRNAAALESAIEQFDLARLENTWTMQSGRQVIVSAERSFVFRVWSVNHLIHHRGQLCVYLRLLNHPVPTVYFNTADNTAMVYE